MKRTLCFLLALLLLSLAVPFAVAAETEGDWTYTVSGGKATVTGYTGNGGNVVIPATLGGYTVSAIGENVFKSCKSLVTVSIPNSVKAIGQNAFYGCTGLTSMTVPYGVTEILSGTFYNCKNITEVTIPGSVTSISNDSFTYCSHLVKVYFSGDESTWKAMTKYNDYLFFVPVEYIAPPVIWGDANCDGVVSNKDIVRLKNYLANYDDETETSTVKIFPGADANGDSAVNNKDVVRLKNYLANYDEETGTSTVTLGTP